MDIVETLPSSCECRGVLLTTRDSVAVLRARGVGSDSARRALRLGLAGPPVATASAVFYDRDAVHELADRPVVRTVDAFELLDPRGLFLARVDVDVRASPQEQRAWLERQFALMSPWNLVNRRIEIEQLGPLPLVATTGTFVTVGADVLDVIPLAGHGRRLVLGEPGDWYAHLAGSRLRGAPGRPWDVYGHVLPWPGQAGPERVRIGP